jgi:hypothetical protein
MLAYAGVKRLGWEDRIAQVIPTDLILPAVGQGALGIESGIQIGIRDRAATFKVDAIVILARIVVSGNPTFHFKLLSLHKFVNVAQRVKISRRNA